MKNLFTWRRTLLGLAAAGLISQCSAFSFGGAEEAVVLPPPALDESTQAHSETAVFAGGCFWGVQGVFQHVKGVKNAVSGYAGGAADTARYERVSNGNTGHAESVEVTFDPSQVSYGTLLRVLFSVVADPTLKNRQGPDAGPQYRAAIVPMDATQRQVATAYLAQIGKGGRGGFGHGNALSGKATLLSAPAAPWQSRLRSPALTAARRHGSLL